jgi:diguanylate cyclase (GGDEF)-like protein
MVTTYVAALENPLSSTLYNLDSTTRSGDNVLADHELTQIKIQLDEAKSHYKNKQFNLAIPQFIEAAQHLANSKNPQDQKLLGITYTDIAQSYKRIKNREKTALFYKKALNVFTRIDNKKYIARTLNTLAEAQRYLDKYETALDYAIKSLDTHSQIVDPEGQAKAHMGIAIIYRHIQRFEASLEHAYQAYLYFKSEQDARGMAKASNEMGLLYTHLKQFDQARTFFSHTIKLPADTIDPATLATAFREMAVIEWNDKNYVKAQELAIRALAIYRTENAISKQSTVSRIIANIYRDIGDIDNATMYYQQSLNLANQANDKLYQIKALIPLGNLLIETNTKHAIVLLEKAANLANEIGSDKNKLYAYSYLRKAEKRQKNFAQALRYAEKEIKLNKITYTQEIAKQEVLVKANLHAIKLEMELASLKEKDNLNNLELEKKNAEILIAKKEKTISDLQLTKNKYASIALFILFIASLLTGIVIYRSFIASKKRNQELRYLATHDPLTSSYNRRYLFDCLNTIFADPLTDIKCSLIMIDIDYFKVINDTHGHIMGDKVLCNVADILRKTVASEDVVARFGGEEFSIILPTSTLEEALKVAEKIRKTLENHQEDNISVTCSLGVSCITEHTKTPSQLIEQADVALFKSKSLGRNQVTAWDAELTR